MKLGLYTIRDKVAQESSPPYVAVNDGVAMRQYRDVLREVEPMSKGDYVLLYLGRYDTETTVIETVEPCQVEAPAQSDGFVDPMGGKDA